MSNLDIHAPDPAYSHCGSAAVVPFGSPPAVRAAGPGVVFRCRPSERFTPEQLTLTRGAYFCPTCPRYTTRFRDPGIRWD